MKLFKLIVAVAILLLIPNMAIAATEDSNITIVKRNWKGNLYKEVVWFSAYNVGDDAGTTYKYNEIEGTSDGSGLVDALHYTQKRTVQIDLITLGSTSVDVRVEGRAGSSTEWGEVATITFTAVTGANNAHIVNVCEFVEELRVGVKANTAGTDSITITGILLGDSR